MYIANQFEVNMKSSYRSTVAACFIGYIVQAIVNNFIPLLFITLQDQYNISLGRITMLVTVNFAVQLTVDFLATLFVDRIGYKASVVSAHIFSAAGLILLPLLPEIMPDPFTGVIISVIIYAVGGGLIEVLISPIMESCPTDNKEKAMSLLHSFYCWGHVGVVVLSTAFFAFFGIENWRLLSAFWALVPFFNVFLFLNSPIAPLISEGEKGMTVMELAKSKVFWMLVVMMVCSGASEQAVSQWASAFAETGLGISKAAGDLAGPMAFAVLMGASRAFYGKYGHKLDLDKFMTGSTALCIITYLVISLVKIPAVSLVGCAFCGLSVGIMWPGTFSRAASSLKRGGTAMFAFLALAGDLGCSGGPTLVGFVSEYAGNDLRMGILAAVAFPALLALCLVVMKKMRKGEKA